MSFLLYLGIGLLIVCVLKVMFRIFIVWPLKALCFVLSLSFTTPLRQRHCR